MNAHTVTRYEATNRFGNRHPGTSRLRPGPLVAMLQATGWTDVVTHVVVIEDAKAETA